MVNEIDRLADIADDLATALAMYVCRRDIYVLPDDGSDPPEIVEKAEQAIERYREWDIAHAK